ncbi:putative transposase YdaD [Actinoplanes octamycinicus]|uniref:Putative transposase YdaD n=1 Tax=Actinoplanes octamycinicus TaxID=135948 RepID=A0A7W7MB09_9ACTN|nr:hypothetical protein [Actinoplanes octamycinicus]MBB4743370.1 putative transposase YdaD [Actinoplanes octamycinicus]GIE61885.1 hypothetical protein Aoc01nite_72870 [Actinoplanes octamycinicus]
MGFDLEKTEAGREIAEKYRELGRQQGQQEGMKLGRQESQDEALSLGRQEGHEKGLSQGRLEGHESGRRLGLQEGREEGLVRAMVVALQVRFGDVAGLGALARKLVSDDYKANLERVVNGVTLDELELEQSGEGQR